MTGLETAEASINSLFAESSAGPLIEAIVAKYLALSEEELQEWRVSNCTAADHSAYLTPAASMKLVLKVKTQCCSLNAADCRVGTEQSLGPQQLRLWTVAKVAVRLSGLV